MPGPLSEQQCQAFHRDGYLVCNEFFNPQQHARLLEWIEEVAGWTSESGRCIHHHEATDHGPVLARSERFLDSHSGIRQVLCEGPLCDALSQLFGEAAYVFKEKINYKYPGGGGFAAHQDMVAYTLGTQHITCLVAIDDNTIENGCLWFAPGRHQEGLLPQNEDSCLPEEVEQSLDWQPAPVAAGGVAFFTSLAPHKSPPNNSPSPRRSLYVTYNRASEGDLRDSYYQERRRIMAENDAAGRGASRISTVGHFQGKAID